MITTQAIGDCEREGRKAFRAHGVSGATKHNYPDGSVQKIGFQAGFSDEQSRAAESALAEAQAYHALSMRDASLDRSWAEKLGATRGH
ncbi:TPA: hypothetical protein ACYLN4_000608 [Burkholderia lata]